MKLLGSKEEQRLIDVRMQFKRTCTCGHTMAIYPTMKKDYIVCSWCGRKVFKDIERQKEHDEKVKRDEFRLKMFGMSKSKK